MKRLKSYGSFVKVEHTLFSFPLILSGAFLGKYGAPEPRLLLLILLAAFGARTAALGLNRIIDREIDKKNPRTMERELPSGKLSLFEAYLVVILGIVVYSLSAYLICDLVFYLSPIPLLVFVAYPYMKRFTSLCHFGVGLGLSLAPFGGWLAVRCSLDGIIPPVLLSLFTFFWVSGFDIIYATLDEEFDRKSGIFSLVSRFGRKKALFISALLHVFSFISLLVLYLLQFRSVYPVFFLLLVGALLLLEHRKSASVDLAFFKINALLGFVVFFFVLSGIYLS
ncbi:MAG: 4-hydroxybenzoate octaprenyltransferase [Deltaproteobacteria bacterium]|jgi:4-hydroxybenzoate polyprenyltransferase|nr:4-hydroxybenzoate solanesyltransferase [bacterium HR37]GIW48048.1 MAG: 4-hydroxybenzoate octaprenyltransferase [Deltaproteobacteria bacterium]